MTEEEKKRRKDRDRRHRDQKSRPSRKLDVIDKLDATGIYGGGRKSYYFDMTRLTVY